MPDVSKCSSCGRAIIWAASPNGARLPLDARAATVYYLDAANPPNAIPLKIDIAGEGDLKKYVSHFITCPNAAEHSRARK